MNFFFFDIESLAAFMLDFFTSVGSIESLTESIMNPEYLHLVEGTKLLFLLLIKKSNMSLVFNCLSNVNVTFTKVIF